MIKMVTKIVDFVKNKGLDRLGRITFKLLSCTSPFSTTFFVGLGLGRPIVKGMTRDSRVNETSAHS